jgi:hypothetical protein
MVQCDACKLWLHPECLHLANPTEVSPFICIFCQQHIGDAVRGYVRAQIHRLRHPEAEGNLTNFWKETLQAIDEVKEMMQCVSLFLPREV